MTQHFRTALPCLVLLAGPCCDHQQEPCLSELLWLALVSERRVSAVHIDACNTWLLRCLAGLSFVVLAARLKSSQIFGKVLVVVD